MTDVGIAHRVLCLATRITHIGYLQSSVYCNQLIIPIAHIQSCISNEMEVEIDRPTVALEHTAQLFDERVRRVLIRTTTDTYRCGR